MPARSRSADLIQGPAERLGTTRRSRNRDAVASLLLATPALVWFSAFMLVPLGAVFYFSTQEWSSLLSTPRYTGLDNYLALASDARLHRALSNTVVQVVVELLIVIVFGYMLGYFLSLKRWGGNVLLTLCLVPILTSAAARALMFTGIFQPQGLLNNALKFVGLGEFTQPWLGTPETALAVIIVVDVWGAIGFTAVMTSAKLSDGSSEIREAAMLDGAGEWKIMWRVSLPMVAPFVGTLAILHFMWALMHSAQNVLLLTRGGPGDASTNLAYLVYQTAFVTKELGYSQAIGVILIVFGVLGMVIIRWLSKDRT